MSGRADYRLRHGVFGMLGSFWSRQLSAQSKAQAAALVTVSSCPERLQRLDAVVNTMAGSRRVTVEDATFRFLDGDFCHVGQDFLAYLRLELEQPDGTKFTFSRRDASYVGDSASTTPRPHQLSSLTAAFVAEVSGEGFDPTSDVYLIPVPRALTPVLIRSRIPGVMLVSGIDFSVHDGYIALRDNPAEVLDAGHVVMPLAILSLDPPNSYTLRAETPRYGNSFLTNYTARAQSVSAFKAAAAEYAGMWVLAQDDVVLAKKVVGDVTVYVMSESGVVEVDYPHNPLSVAQVLRRGDVVGLRYDVTDRRSTSYDALIKNMVGGTGGLVSLDGVLSVKGLSYDPATTVLADHVATGDGGRYHTRLHFEGDGGLLTAHWTQQQNHELLTGDYLSDEIDLNDGTPTLDIDFSALLETFYGDAIILVVVKELPEVMQGRLMEFLYREKPAGCVLLTCVI